MPGAGVFAAINYFSRLETELGGQLTSKEDIFALNGDNSHGTQWELPIQANADASGTRGILPLYIQLLKSVEAEGTYESASN
jgi:hypothetical protein